MHLQNPRLTLCVYSLLFSLCIVSIYKQLHEQEVVGYTVECFSLNAVKEQA